MVNFGAFMRSVAVTVSCMWQSAMLQCVRVLIVLKAISTALLMYLFTTCCSVFCSRMFLVLILMSCRLLCVWDMTIYTS